MVAFFIGLCLAILVALGAVLGVNAFDQSTADAFYTRYTVASDVKVPTDGRLAHSPQTPSESKEAEKTAQRR